MWGKAACILLLLLACAWVGGGKGKENPKVLLPPDLLLQDGRKLAYERAFSTEKEVRGKPGFWARSWTSSPASLTTRS